MSHRFAIPAIVTSLALVALSAASVSGQSPAASPAMPAASLAIPASITDPTVLANISTAIAYEDAVDEVDVAAVDALLADDFVSEGDRFTLEHDAATNDDEIVLAQKLEELYPGSTNTITSIGGWGDQVVMTTMWTIPSHTLTADGTATDLDAPLEVEGIVVLTIVDGLVTHEISVVDQLGLLTGVGVIPPMGN